MVWSVLAAVYCAMILVFERYIFITFSVNWKSVSLLYQNLPTKYINLYDFFKFMAPCIINDKIE
jgi:hypothetical protein